MLSIVDVTGIMAGLNRNFLKSQALVFKMPTMPTLPTLCFPLTKGPALRDSAPRKGQGGCVSLCKVMSDK